MTPKPPPGDPFKELQRELASNGHGLPAGGAVILERAKSIDYATLELPVGVQCLCTEITNSMVPYIDIARGSAGFAFECAECGAQWAVAAKLETTVILIRKPTEVPE